jgi:phytanoyl-CoA hydroxylase
VCPHQDGAFLFTIPQSVVGFWWALNDCTTENGCLWAVPGSHKTVPVSRLFRRKDPPDTGTEFIPPEPIQWNIEGAIPLIIPAGKLYRAMLKLQIRLKMISIVIGSLVILHGAVVHYSLENKSPIPRHAYSLHVIEGKPGFIYPEDNWLQRPQDYPFRELQL